MAKKKATKNEHEKECCYCNERFFKDIHVPWAYKTTFKARLFIENEGKMDFYVEQEEDEQFFADNRILYPLKDRGVGISLQVNYCPYCGRKLTSKSDPIKEAYEKGYEDGTNFAFKAAVDISKFSAKRVKELKEELKNG